MGFILSYQLYKFLRDFSRFCKASQFDIAVKQVTSSITTIVGICQVFMASVKICTFLCDQHAIIFVTKSDKTCLIVLVCISRNADLKY